MCLSQDTARPNTSSILGISDIQALTLSSTENLHVYYIQIGEFGKQPIFPAAKEYMYHKYWQPRSQALS